MKALSTAWRHTAKTTETMTSPKVDLILSGASQVLTCASTAGDPLGRLPGVAIAVQGEKIAAIAPLAELERRFDLSSSQTVDLAGQIVAPGFVDCHTHLVFGGSRAQEYAARMTHTAQEVAALGIPTGIQATVKMTRESSPDLLYEGALGRLQRMLRCGTTTLESKSGYGLNAAKEIELLQVNRKLQSSQPVDIVSTFLGAHDFPTEVSHEQYLESLIHEMIPQVAAEGLAEFCDVYCDDGYYSVEASRRILEAGLRHGLKPKIHVDAYSNLGGCAMAADLPVVSADHLNFTTEPELERLAMAGVVGVVMPGLDFAVRHPQPFNARLMIDKGLTVALATDFCPGCWLESMQLVMQLACRLYQFSPAEALLAATVNAARAVGLTDRGTLEPGQLADLQTWDLPTFEDLIYRLGNNAVSLVVKRGRIVYSKGVDR
jgi:imidazolonepropionase